MNERSTGGFPGTNQMVVVGRLTKDPELKYVGDNETAKAEFRLAVDNGRAGTLFLDVEAWGNSAEAIAEHCTKGRKVAASGRLELDQWQRNDGTTASRHYLNTTSGGVEFLDSPTRTNDNGRDRSGGRRSGRAVSR